jgi:hypothetical protein
VNNPVLKPEKSVAPFKPCSSSPYISAGINVFQGGLAGNPVEGWYVTGQLRNPLMLG